MRLLRLVFIVEMHSQPPLTCRRYMAEILPIQGKTPFNPSITINIIISIVHLVTKYSADFKCFLNSEIYELVINRLERMINAEH